MSKIKTGLNVKRGRAQSSGLKRWYTTRRDAKRNQGPLAAGAVASSAATSKELTPEGSTSDYWVPPAARRGVEVSTQFPKPRTGPRSLPQAQLQFQLLRQGLAFPHEPMSTASSMPAPQAAAPLLDTFGRPLHRHRDAVRAASRSAARKVEARRQNGKMFLWPLIEGGLDLIDARAFDWQAHADSFHKGSAITVYVATCDAICELGSRARLPIAKIGISERLDLNERMDELNGIGYANIARDALGACTIEHGFDDWHPLRLSSNARPDGDSPVEWSPTRLLVSLPATLDAQTFDTLLKAALAHAAILDWSQSEDGRIHCARANINQRALQRFSAYPQAAGGLRLSGAEELYCFRSAHDPAILVRIIETIIAGHLIAERDQARAMVTNAAIASAALGNVVDTNTFLRRSAFAQGRTERDPTEPSSGYVTQTWPHFWSMTLK